MDGTLIATDLLWESLLVLLKKSPWLVVIMPLWLLKGRAYFKRQLALRASLDVASLPYRDEVVEFLKRERAAGREIVLATAADRALAESVAQRLGLFSAVLASDGNVSLSGDRKLQAVQAFAGSRGFDYAGNARADLPLWRAAGVRIVVCARPRLVRQIERMGPIAATIESRGSLPLKAIRALRVNQWAKNALLFVPLLTSHKIGEPGLLRLAALGFFSLSLCASATYILNDLFDLESDRHHPTKRFRPFATGSLPIAAGVLAVPLLLASGFALAAFLLPHGFLAALAIYVVTTVAYSFGLKRILAVDVLILAGLYTLRVLAGGIVEDIPISEWLLAFSVFFFLSLAFAKRYAELRKALTAGETVAKGRGYVVGDLDLLRSLGVTSGYLSVLVFALYINSKDVEVLYRHAQSLWLICAPLLYWITRVWFLAGRGEMDDDPVLFTLRDPLSYGIGAVVAVLLFIAA